MVLYLARILGVVRFFCWILILNRYFPKVGRAFLSFSLSESQSSQATIGGKMFSKRLQDLENGKHLTTIAVRKHTYLENI
jgi:hypothetical protein